MPPPDLSVVKQGATKSEIEGVLGPPAECDTTRPEEKRCTYWYSYRAPVATWVGPFPPFLPVFDPDFWKSQKRAEVSVTFGQDDVALDVTPEVVGISWPEKPTWDSWVTSACLNDSMAQTVVGVHYHLGLDPVGRDRPRPYKWYSIAIENGGGMAKIHKRTLMDEMTSDEISEAERLLSEWDHKRCTEELEEAARSVTD